MKRKRELCDGANSSNRNNNTMNSNCNCSSSNNSNTSENTDHNKFANIFTDPVAS